MKGVTFYACSCLKPFKVIETGDLFGTVRFVEFDGEHREVAECPDCGRDLHGELERRNDDLERLNKKVL